MFTKAFKREEETFAFLLLVIHVYKLSTPFFFCVFVIVVHMRERMKRDKKKGCWMVSQLNMMPMRRCSCARQLRT